MPCEICGSETNLVKADIEGASLIVCKNCARFGKITGSVKVEASQEVHLQARQPLSAAEEPFEFVVKDFPSILKKKRESLGLNQEDFAKKLNEKLSIVQKMESGEFTPSLDAARKLGKLLGIKLVEQFREEQLKTNAGSSEGFTIGDVVKIKKR
jgi:putative transcription factor